MPVAQTQVLRRVLTGGISTNRCLAAAAGSKYGLPSLRKKGVLERGPVGGCWVVFGTLLGPEATGPGFPGAGLFLVSWLHRSCAFRVLAGRVCGVCGTGLLFENYIVDASIFYKKQFPRI
jgi:hypothetical protein